MTAAENPVSKKERSRFRKWMMNLTLMFFSLGVSFFIAELAFRWMLFGGRETFKSMRDPARYASVYSEEYWKLNFYWDKNNRPPKHPHPLLGWAGNFHSFSYLHNDFIHGREKRPVLLFGDSFSQCVDSVECFQDILNRDSAFSEQNYLLNYGTGGYGLDQIYLLAKETVKRYKDPFVVFGLLTTDIDRSILSVRTGQKPYFIESGDSILLSGIPIASNADSFFNANPPGIKSYLLRGFLFSSLNFLPWKINPQIRGDLYYEKKIRSLNEKILKKAIADLNQLGVDYVFLIYHYENTFKEENESRNWRDTFLLRVLEENQAPYIWSKNLVRKDTLKPYKFERYIIPGDGHPTSYFNRLISSEIKSRVLQSDGYPENFADSTDSKYFVNEIRELVNGIQKSPDWLQTIQADAQKKNRPLDELIWENAIYLFNENSMKKK